VVRLETLERTKRHHGRIDVLFVGSSIVRTNIRPLIFDQIVNTRTNSRIVSFNAGLSGLWPPAVRLYAERLWLPTARPRLVIQGIRYPELAATTHALRETQVFSGTVEAAWRETTWPTRMYSAAAERVHLLQYRGTLVQLLQRYVNGRPGRTRDGDGRDAMDVRGYTPRTPSLREGRTRLATHALAHPGHSCQADACQVGFAALRQTIQAVRRAGADYVLVNVPEHGARWRGPGGLERYEAYLGALATFAAEEGVQFLDPTDGDPYLFDSDDEYSDIYHMTPAGAERLTAVLAQRLRTVAAGRMSRPPLHVQK
jgi:hypothetical protein